MTKTPQIAALPGMSPLGIAPTPTSAAYDAALAAARDARDARDAARTALAALARAKAKGAM